MDTKTFNRATLYLQPLLGLYGTNFIAHLIRAKILSVYAGDQNKDTKGLYIVTEEAPGEHEFIAETYYSFSLRSYVSIVPILAKYDGILEAFWSGQYDQMYESLDHVARSVGGKVNPVYHVLKNTSIGKAIHKNNLIKFGLVDHSKFTDFDTFEPPQADFPPRKKNNILNYEESVAENTEMAE